MNMANFNKQRNSSNSEAGYSLFELLVVMIVLSILASVALNSIQPNVDIVKTEETKEELDELANAIVGDRTNISGGKQVEYGYVGDIGALPSSLSDLVTNPGLATWDGPYVKDNFYTSSGSTEYEYLIDGWGKTYTYSGGSSIISDGGSTTITKKIANSTSDILYNTIAFNLYDSSYCPPGEDYKDSVSVRITVPDGSGSYVVLSKHPHSDGFISFDSLPIGQHELEIIEQTNADTLKRKVDIEINSDTHLNLQLPIALWCDTTGIDTTSGTTSYSEILRPNGSGQYSQLEDENCSTNWQCVDEVSADDNSTYVKGDNSSLQRDLYTLTDPTTTTGTIDSIVVHILVEGEGSGHHHGHYHGGSSDPYAQTYIRTDNSNYEGSSINLDDVNDYTEYTTTYIQNPETSSDWTWSEIVDLEAGVRLTEDARCTQVWVEVFYTN